MATTKQHPFADLPRTPAAHFKLHLFAAISRIIRQAALTLGTEEVLLTQYPFLRGYRDELAGREPAGLSIDAAARWWDEALRAWEATAEAHLPLRALRVAGGLSDQALSLLMCVGLSEEDARFAWLFEAMQGSTGQHGPTLGLLQTWWRAADGDGSVRADLRQLRALGLLPFVPTTGSGAASAVQVDGVLWEVMRGACPAQPAPGLRYHRPDELTALDDLVIAAALRQQLRGLPAALATGEAQTVVVRGPQRNGRRTLLGALARMLGRGLLVIDSLKQPDDQRWQMIGSLATMLSALPVVVGDVAPGEHLELPQWRGYEGCTGVVLGQHGGVTGAGVERALTLQLEMPDMDARRCHWQQSLAAPCVNGLAEISERFRLTSGNIRRAARLAAAYAALAGRAEVTPDDVRQASSTLNRQTLETLAARLPVTGDWSELAASAETMRELRHLEARCRHRERLHEAVGAALGRQLNVGVRALFSGPSGTGKTLAARLLAAALQMDLYRLDLAAVVNKYIGETEKNLSQLFARAEELDVMLLLDEGDALLTQRTEVGNANDRYANLETNYLLQRLESFAGILLVTTNASDRIDSAFHRRMDVVVNFPLPDAVERWMIWQLHLPASHRVPAELLDEMAQRCELNGGQIRNAVLHASLLALGNGGVLSDDHLAAAVRREYRKAGAICPLRATPDAFYLSSSAY